MGFNSLVLLSGFKERNLAGKRGREDVPGNHLVTISKHNLE